MALTITKLKMWNDPGYTRGSLEVPPIGSKKLPMPDYISPEGQTLRPRKGSTLTSLELPLSYLKVMNMSYLYIEAYDSMSSIKLFGWIDDVALIATSSEAVRIDWSVDYWRSYSDKVVFGSGTITRCSQEQRRRPFSTHPRKWVVSHFERLNNGSGAYETYPYAVTISYNETVENETKIKFAYWRCSQIQGEQIIEGSNTYKALSLLDVFSGVVDERLGIDPDNMIGIFITPFEPWARQTSHIIKKGEYFAYVKDPYLTSSKYIRSYQQTYKSDDMYKTVIMDPNGSILYTLPWGYEINQISASIDAGTTACNVLFTLSSNNEGVQPVELLQSGRGGSIPGIVAPFNRNAWSSYVYSGQRDYDREMRNIQRDQQAISGITSLGQSGIGGAIAGAGAGPMGIIGGLLGGIGVGAIGTAANYFAAGYFNDRLSDETDKLYSNQSSNVIQPAGGMGFCDQIKDWYIVQLEADSVSRAEYTAFIQKNGYSTEIPVLNSTREWITNGPIQISNQVITGIAPPEAKQFIKNTLANGVFVKENNQSGVEP